MKPNSSILSLVFTASVMTIAVINFQCGECKTVKLESQISPDEKYRKLDNFVDFTEEGDQLSLESTRTATEEEESTGNKRGILGKKTSETSTTGRQCANVQKAVLPVIPVIIASLVGLIGAIIISAIVRLVFRLMSEKDTDGYSESGYDRRVGKRTFFGFDLNNMNFARLAKTVLSAVEKIY